MRASLLWIQLNKRSCEKIQIRANNKDHNKDLLQEYKQPNNVPLNYQHY